jgi:deoxyribose-phosphate aldolase
LIADVQVDQDEVERAAQAVSDRPTLGKRRLKGWLVRAISCMDLTSLSDDDTPHSIRTLCAKARRPVRQEVMNALGPGHPELTTAAVCVFPALVGVAVEALADSGIPVATVAGGFPRGLPSLRARTAEIEASVAAGAREIDIVITRSHALAENWEALYDEVAALREACGKAHLKTILATGDLGDLATVQRASLVCMMAGADFIKTSTGRERVNATLPVGLVMARAIRAYDQDTGFRVGLKPAGGIRKAEQALDWLALVKEELGNPWLEPGLFRIGASSLLAELEEQLEGLLTG